MPLLQILLAATAVVKYSRSIIYDKVFGCILASHIRLVSVWKRYGMTLFNCVYREVFRHCSILFTYDLMPKSKTIAPDAQDYSTAARHMTPFAIELY
jgi:hypothetical protein